MIELVWPRYKRKPRLVWLMASIVLPYMAAHPWHHNPRDLLFLQGKSGTRVMDKYMTPAELERMLRRLTKDPCRLLDSEAGTFKFRSEHADHYTQMPGFPHPP